MRLTVDDVAFRYPGAPAPLYAGVSTEWRRGELAAVVGPSGSGKSTLLDLLGRLRAPTRGSVELRVDGEDAVLGDREHRRACAWVLQTNTVLAGRTVLDNVTIGLRARGEASHDARERALEVLDALGLVDTADRLVDQLSGGERQRVTIARCMAAPASLILADEPTGNLDAANTAAVVTALRAAAEEGKIVVVATHDAAVFDACDDVLDLRGRAA